MDTKSLMSFKTVYEAGSITKAASRLYITQQGLSKTIARLEAELGVALFERTHQGVGATAYANALYPRVDKLVSMLEDVRREALLSSTHVTLHVASVSGNLSYLGIGFVSDFEAAFPGIALEVIEGSDRFVEEKLASGAADVGFIVGPVDGARYDAELFVSRPHVAVLSSDDPLAGKDCISYADLEGRVVALLNGDYRLNANNRERFARSGVHPAKIVEVAEIDTAYQMAVRGQAICLSGDYWSLANPWPQTAILPFEDPSCTCDFFLVARKGDVLGEEARLFRDFAFRWLDEHEGDLFHWDGAPWRG